MVTIPQRHRRRGRRKPDLRSTLHSTVLLLIAVLLVLPACSAQDTTVSTSLLSTRTTGVSSTTSITSSSSSKSSTRSASSVVSTPSATRTYALPTIPTSLSLPALNVSEPVIQLDIPSASTLYLTFSICSLSSNTTLLPTILISTEDEPTFNLGTKTNFDPSSGGLTKGNYNTRNGRNGDVWGLAWEKGFGNWTLAQEDEVQVKLLFGLGLQPDGTTIAFEGDVEVTGGMIISLGVSTDAPLHALSPAYPLLGDTTSSLALLFSPLLVSSPHEEPSYPNYTLPSPQLIFEPFSSASASGSTDNVISENSSLSTNLSLIVLPTNISPTQEGLDHSFCAILQSNLVNSNSSANSTENLGNANNVVMKSDQPQWMSLGGQEGYRHLWTIGGLSPETNYTTWIVDDSGVMAGPSWFVTKEESFPCQLLLPTSICPSIAYAAPLPANSSAVTSPSGDEISPVSPVQSLPDEVTSVLTSNLESFSTSLLSHACGRDLYSHVSTCAGCFSAYRDWLCRTVIPQCASSSNTSPASDGDDDDDDGDSYPTPKTVHRTPSDLQNSGLPVTVDYEYDQLLPCLSGCNAVDRKCPVDMGFRCPKRHVNAALDYAFLGKQSDSGDGSLEGGTEASNRWGGRWCNG